jgi:hypothetical protein
VVTRLTAVLSTLAAVDAALAAFLAHEAAAEHGETAHKAAAVLLLLGGRSLLLVHGLLVLHLLGRRALLVSLLGVALGRAVRLLRVLRLLVAVVALGRHCGSVVTSPFVEKGLCLCFVTKVCENTQKYSQLLIDVKLFFTGFVVTRAGRSQAL